MDYTTGSLRKAVFTLAIPMILEMCMESVFAVVDLYFVGHLPDSSHAIQTVGLTESVITIVYSLAIGISMAATALVARRVGEKNPDAAAYAGMQAIWLSVFVTIAISMTALAASAAAFHLLTSLAVFNSGLASYNNTLAFSAMCGARHLYGHAGKGRAVGGADFSGNRQVLSLQG